MDRIFSRTVIKIGKRAAPKRHACKLMTWLEYFEEFAAGFVDFKHLSAITHVGFLRDLSFNAFAIDLGNDAIAINIGVIPSLSKFFRDVTVGGTTASRLLGEIITSRPGVVTRKIADYLTGIDLADPSEALARYLQRQSVLFLFFHELGHLRRGHLKYLKWAHGAAFISEIEMIPSSQAEHGDRRALEMDADLFATRLLIADAYGWRNTDHFHRNPVWEVYGSGASAIVLAMISVHCLLRFFDRESARSGTESPTHPPFAYRQWLFADVAAREISNILQIKVEDATHLAYCAILEAEKAIADLAGEEVDLSRIIAASEAKDYFRETGWRLKEVLLKIGKLREPHIQCA
jgi:hypothetical protein